MNNVIVIPARYASTRLPGKPLMMIGKKPMIWWVYEKCKQVEGVTRIIVATDSEKIENVCHELGMDVVLTSETHANHVLRVAEVSQTIQADYYICVNGDEPLINSDNIKAVIPDSACDNIYAGYCIRELTNIGEATDTSNIKVVRKANEEALYLSRMIIPYPKGNPDITYFKLIGIECFNKAALDFYSNTPMGLLEKTEDIDHLRFLENGIAIKTTIVDSESISVDTAKDLEYVRKILENE